MPSWAQRNLLCRAAATTRRPLPPRAPAATDEDGWGPAHYAALANAAPVLRVLCAAAPPADAAAKGAGARGGSPLAARNADGHSPLDVALREGADEAVAVLREAAAEAAPAPADNGTANEVKRIVVKSASIEIIACTGTK